MAEESIAERMNREWREERAAQAAAQASRQRFLESLFGSSDRLTWQAPAKVEDFDTLLAQHAAQLSNAVRYAMGDAMGDSLSPQSRSGAMAVITRMVQANIAIAKVLGPVVAAAKSKTVHGGQAATDPQD